ncbi:Radical SAM domain heme biosynthesis protein [Enhygromyxa salina]|uniref:Radical SAM domain heme biosynthesis protein n=1 Tax=Enhygromyxa salina TaxID=215803 RepID=A0A0C2D0W8_9BACT|nr:radical SAM protein [Enhygromyxa salina]KIG15490.1 Radical SAM domain heme biosynthesis protein [Enhygromyxa salina]
MARLMLRLTTRCNSACAHCTVADVPAGEVRTAQQALAEIVEARRRGCDELVIMRGEPTLRPELAKLASAARRIGYRLVQIQTNGRLLCYPDYLERLVRAGVDFYEVSLFGATAATHDAISADEGAFEQTLAGLRLLAARPQLGHLVTVAVLAANLHELTAMVELVAALGLARVQLNFTRPVRVDGEWRTDLLAKLDDAGPAIRAALRRARALGLASSTEAVPLCQLDPEDRPAAETARDFVDVRVVDLHRRHASFATHHRQVRPHAPQCGDCRLAQLCPTTWAAYQELFGTSELRPVR